MQGTDGGGLLSVAPEHLAALIALIATPIAGWLLTLNARNLARNGADLAEAFVRRLDRLAFGDRFALLLLATTGVAHLALVPTHWGDERQTAILFALNGLAFLGVIAMALLATPGWRAAAIALVVATVIAYVWYVATGREDADLVGLLVKGVELVALAALLVAPSRVRGHRIARPVLLAVAVLAVFGLGGAVASAALHDTSDSHADSAAMADAGTTPMVGMAGATPMAGMAPNQMATLPPAVQAMVQQESGCFGGQLPMPMNGDDDMLMAPVPDRSPTTAEQNAADTFAQQVTRGIAQYADVQAARAAGYRPLGPQIPGTMTHWINLRFMAEGDPLDPSRPGALMMENSSNGPQLVGAMFILPDGQCPPDFGGPITDWHVHTNLCYSTPQGGWLVGVETARQPTCAAGSYNHVSQWMLHVWTVPVPGGPFAQAEQVEQALRNSGR